MKTHLTGLPRALLVLAVTYAVGCTCDETDVVLDDFQFCDDGCGWVADSGEALMTSRTFHSAELGLVIPSGVSARRSGGVSGEELHVVSNCATGLEVRVSSDVDVPPFHLHATTAERDNAWYRLAVVISTEGERFDYLAVTNTNSAPCVIDQVRMLDTGECF